jgi:hypothetical protein
MKRKDATERQFAIAFGADPGNLIKKAWVPKNNPDRRANSRTKRNLQRVAAVGAAAAAAAAGAGAGGAENRRRTELKR